MEHISNDSVWLVDTDYSLDDQFALEYMINKVKIIAITVSSFGGTKPAVIKRKIEDDLKNKFNVDIPVYAGADRPYVDYTAELKDDEIFDAYNVIKTDYSSYEQIETKSDLSKENIQVRLSNTAAIKIIELVKQYEHKLNVLTLGPLTNFSLASSLDQNVRDKVGHIFIVGGSFNNLGNSGNAAEFNFRSDPVAAKNVIRYCKNITLIPLEIETQINLTALKKGKISAQLAEVLDLLPNNGEEESRSYFSLLSYFAVLVLLNPELIKTKATRPTEVDIIGRFTRGALIIEKYDYLKSGKLSDIEIIEEINSEGFLNKF